MEVKTMATIMPITAPLDNLLVSWLADFEHDDRGRPQSSSLPLNEVNGNSEKNRGIDPCS
ncbi:hypothetical protein IC582_029719 [Cucumis melo]